MENLCKLTHDRFIEETLGESTPLSGSYPSHRGATRTAGQDGRTEEDAYGDPFSRRRRRYRREDAKKYISEGISGLLLSIEPFCG
eukprot:646177-Hanusia_phi.AAC.1